MQAVRSVEANRDDVAAELLEAACEEGRQRAEPLEDAHAARHRLICVPVDDAFERVNGGRANKAARRRVTAFHAVEVVENFVVALDENDEQLVDGDLGVANVVAARNKRRVCCHKVVNSRQYRLEQMLVVRRRHLTCRRHVLQPTVANSLAFARRRRRHIP